MTDIYDINSYNYDLPESQIAQNPTQPQHDCKLLHCKIADDKIIMEDKIFRDIIDILTPNDVIYFNNSQVVPSRIYISCDNKDQKILQGDWVFQILVIWPDWLQKILQNWEIFWLRRLSSDTHEFLVRPWSKLKTWTKIYIWLHELTIVSNTQEGREVRISPDINIYQFLDKYGSMPLPPYIWYDKSKDQSYQPIFAAVPGSVASPTASLHFTDYIMDNLVKKWISQNFVTLHVGMWTFKSVNVQNIKDYEIHAESAEVNLDIFEEIYQQKIDGKKILSVGTTSARTMESLPYVYILLKDKLSMSDKSKIWRNDLTKNLDKSDYITNIYISENIVFETQIYIYPLYQWKIVDKLITNFHLPKSSLMMLVASLMWYDNMTKSYKHAIDNDYRFYSFGDAMYIDISW